MTPSLEERLAAAGEQLDELIDHEQPVIVGVAERPTRTLRTVGVLVSLCTIVLMVVGLVWASRPDEPSRAPTADTGGPLPTSSITTALPGNTVQPEPTPPSGPATPPVTPTTMDFDKRPPVAIGESVMMGASSQLAAGGFLVDAEESRQGDETADLVEQLAADGELGRIVVLQVGTNGPVSADVYRRMAEALVDVDQVVFLTVHADRSWIPDNNAVIRSLPTRYPNVTVVFWDDLVAEGAVAGMASDGIHLGTWEARQTYANYVFSAIGRADLVRATRVSDLFVTVSDDRPAVIDVRNATDVIGSFDVGCPQGRTCTVQSARVMGDTVWVAISDTDPNDPTTEIASRVVSVSASSGEIVEHISLRGNRTAQAAGRGANGILYAYLRDENYNRQLVSIDNGDLTVLDTGVSGFLLSDDGRFLAVSFSNPPASETPRIRVTDLTDGTTNTFQTDGINAGPGAWAPDGRHLIINEQWEDGTAWVVDPWGPSPEPTPAGVFLDGACFVDAVTVAHRTWNVGYGQGDAQLGVIRLSGVEDGSTTAALGENLFGDNTIRCHPDGSVTYLRRPVVDVDLGGGSTQPQPNYDAPVDVVRLQLDGTASTIASDRLRMV